VTLYVTNLPGDTRPADLAVLFGAYGWVTAASVGADPNPDADPAGLCGSVRLDHGGWGLAAVTLNGGTYRGRKLGVRTVMPWGRLPRA
jgi:hypothetical protein